MADIDSKVLAAVEAALKDKPDATVDELFAMATTLNSDIAGLSKRQFHARYPLQIKRKLSPPKPRRPRRPRKAVGRKGKASTDGAARDAVRAAFLDFATELAAAEERRDVVRVVAGVDQYVDRVLEAAAQA